MITFRCDRCDRTLEMGDDKAGTKMECPDCGDVNIVPEAKVEAPPAKETKTYAATRLDELGLPPDEGPEVRVLKVRRSLFRGSPFRCASLLLLPIVGPVLLYLLLGQLGTNNRDTISWWAFAVVAALSWGWLFVWWAVTTLSRSCMLTNKRTIEHRGIIRRATSEVMHDHVRNIRIDQSVMDRILNVGRVGISSSGQDGIEIETEDLPNPGRIKEIIDAYRPM